MDKVFQDIEALLRSGTWRKYELQDALGITRGEVDYILSTLTREGKLENTSQGWRWRRDDEENYWNY